MPREVIWYGGGIDSRHYNTNRERALLLFMDLKELVGIDIS